MLGFRVQGVQGFKFWSPSEWSDLFARTCAARARGNYVAAQRPITILRGKLIKLPHQAERISKYVRHQAALALRLLTTPRKSKA